MAKRRRLVKGSPAAKRYMAKLRKLAAAKRSAPHGRTLGGKGETYSKCQLCGATYLGTKAMHKFECPEQGAKLYEENGRRRSRNPVFYSTGRRNRLGRRIHAVVMLESDVRAFKAKHKSAAGLPDRKITFEFDELGTLHSVEPPIVGVSNSAFSALENFAWKELCKMKAGGVRNSRRNPTDYQDVLQAAQRVGYSVQDAARVASAFKRTGELPSMIEAQLRYFGRRNPRLSYFDGNHRHHQKDAPGGVGVSHIRGTGRPVEVTLYRGPRMIAEPSRVATHVTVRDLTSNPPRRDALDKQIEQAWYRLASGVQVSILDIPKIFKYVREQVQFGQPLDGAITMAVARFGQNTNPRARRNPRTYSGLRFDDVKKELNSVGVTITRNQWGEFRVNLRGGSEDSAYYTGDLADARGSGLDMVRPRSNPRRARRNFPMPNPSDNPGARELARDFVDGKTRGTAGGLYIHGNRIYSYGPHFPIAEWREGEGVFITTRRSPSVTTSKHITLVKNAVQDRGMKLQYMELAPEAEGPSGYSNPRGRHNPATCMNPRHGHGSRARNNFPMPNPRRARRNYFSGRLNDRERSMWIDNDEGLYNWWRSSRLSKSAFIRENKAELDAAILRALGREPGEGRQDMRNPRRARRNPLLQMVTLAGMNPAGKVTEYTLTSTEMIHTPGIFRWAQTGYNTSRGREKDYFVNILVQGYSLPENVADGLLSGRIPHKIKGENLIFVTRAWAKKNPALRPAASLSKLPIGRGRAKSNPLPMPNPANPPFKNGQKVPVEKAWAWVQKTGNRDLIAQFKKAWELQKKANKDPKHVIWRTIPIGSDKKIEMVTAMAHYGDSPDTYYVPPKGSKKGDRTLYRHKWGEGGKGKKSVPLLAAASGKALIMPLDGKKVAGDWLRH